MNIFIEATGSLTSNYLIEAIQESGHRVIGSDITEFNHGKILCDDFIHMPKTTDTELWQKTTKLLLKYKVDIVIPSLDETMLEWANRIKYYDELAIKVIISPKETIAIFQDKYKSYNFFNSIGINTPKTSLQAIHEIIKPRQGHGGNGIFTNTYENNFSMQGMISQERIKGQEYTVDVLFDKNSKPIYIIPRKRIAIKNGKSTKGIVKKNSKIDALINKISNHIRFIGAVNFQLFETLDKVLIFIEVNPRIAGGMALGFQASENWINVMIKNIIFNEEIKPKKINYGLKMVRYYKEIFF